MRIFAAVLAATAFAQEFSSVGFPCQDYAFVIPGGFGNAYCETDGQCARGGFFRQASARVWALNCPYFAALEAQSAGFSNELVASSQGTRWDIFFGPVTMYQETVTCSIIVTSGDQYLPC